MAISRSDGFVWPCYCSQLDDTLEFTGGNLKIRI